MLPPKPNKRITFQARPTQPRVRNKEKGYAMVVDYMNMSGPCVHIRVGPISVKWPNKRPQTSWPTKKNDGQSTCLMSKKLGHPTKKCPIYKEARKEAQVAIRWATRLIDVHTSKTSIEQTKAAYAMLVKERGI